MKYTNAMHLVMMLRIKLKRRKRDERTQKKIHITTSTISLSR